MDPYYREWLALLVRWLHVIAGIAWIGSSFYFNWLDGNLRRPEKPKEGVAGELWSVHGGGFYVVEKYQVAPEVMPKTLHWFKWEAYTTWLSGVGLLVLVYYLGGSAMMVDPSKANVTHAAALAIGACTLIVGWVVYDVLCLTPLVDKPNAFAVVGLCLLTGAAYGLSLVLGNRAAYIHVGAMLGTIMVGNVFFVIIPGQRALVSALSAGKEPDAVKGLRAKQRSTHNNYITLPVLFIMISNHYPMTFDHRFGWLVLTAIAIIGAGVRHWFNLRNKGVENRWLLPGAAVAMLGLILVTAPRATQASGPEVKFVDAYTVMQKRCVSCHSKSPTDNVFTVAPNGVMFDTPEEIKGRVDSIRQRAVSTTSMPLGNKTQMTDEERDLLGRWIAQGAPIE
jgi:uncharacterized membrane protein